MVETSSNAREEYEAHVERAYQLARTTIDDVWQDYRDDTARAWYNYQVRTGMIPVPNAPSAETEQEDNDGAQAAATGAQDATDAILPPAFSGDAHTGEGSSDPGSARTADEGA